MSELKPCPFCGGDNLQLSSHSGYRARMSPTGEIFTIRCLGCGVAFPSEYQKDLLVGKWNNRSPQDNVKSLHKVEAVEALRQAIQDCEEFSRVLVELNGQCKGHQQVTGVVVDDVGDIVIC